MMETDRPDRTDALLADALRARRIPPLSQNFESRLLLHCRSTTMSAPPEGTPWLAGIGALLSGVALGLVLVTGATASRPATDASAQVDQTILYHYIYQSAV